MYEFGILFLFYIYKEKKYSILFFCSCAIYVYIFLLVLKKLFSFLGLFIFYVLSLNKKWKVIVILSIIIPLVYLIFNKLMEVPYFYNLIGYRIKTAIEIILGNHSNSNGSTAIRISMIKRGLQLWNNKSILGYGLDTDRYISGFGTYSHNNFIELLIDIGLLGLSIYCSIYIDIISKFTKIFINKKKEIIPIFIIILFLILMGIALVFYDSRLYSLLVALSFINIKLYEDNHKVRR